MSAGTDVTLGLTPAAVDDPRSASYSTPTWVGVGLFRVGAGSPLTHLLMGRPTRTSRASLSNMFPVASNSSFSVNPRSERYCPMPNALARSFALGARNPSGIPFSCIHCAVSSALRSLPGWCASLLAGCLLAMMPWNPSRTCSGIVRVMARMILQCAMLSMLPLYRRKSGWNWYADGLTPWQGLRPRIMGGMSLRGPRPLDDLLSHPSSHGGGRPPRTVHRSFAGGRVEKNMRFLVYGEKRLA